MDAGPGRHPPRLLSGSRHGPAPRRRDRRERAPHRPLWLPYVQVGDIGAATDRALALGAALLLAPREGPAGWRSVVSTPVGGELAFWQQKR